MFAQEPREVHERLHLDPLERIRLVPADQEREADLDCLLVPRGGPDGVHNCLSTFPKILSPGMPELNSEGELRYRCPSRQTCLVPKPAGDTSNPTRGVNACVSSIGKYCPAPLLPERMLDPYEFLCVGALQVVRPMV